MNNTFIPYQQARSIIENHKSNFETTHQNLEDCIGAYLAEDLSADRDFPPFDRVTMDGIAIDYKLFTNGQRSFSIEAIAAAGSPQLKLQKATHCIEVMTGCIMPLGTDTVIRYEDLHIENNMAHIKTATIWHKQNVHFKGSDVVKDRIVVHKGKKISSAEITIAASLGKVTLQVKKMPKVIVFSTGDELVPIHKTPEPHQIRRSNSYGITAMLKEWGIPADMAHLNDHKSEMVLEISKSMAEYDVLIFSGGVSKGKFDFLPEVLESLGVKKLFHKIQQRPGKPFWFGTTDTHKKIFALPGNPVSSFVCMYVYFRFWLQKSLSITSTPVMAKLTTKITFKPDLVYFLEATLDNSNEGVLMATPIKGNGSGDFTNLVKTDGFLVLPQGKNTFLEGEVYPFIRYRSY